MRKTSVHSQKHKRDGENCAIVLVSWDKSEGGIDMNPMKQAFSPFGKILNLIKVSCSISMMKYSGRVTKEVHNRHYGFFWQGEFTSSG
jgi:hypothetical protein